MSGPRVDPERLAALLDGRLAEPERSALLAELAKSPEDLALLADASAIGREHNVTPIADAPRVRRPRWRLPPGAWLAAAAGIVGVAVTLTVREGQRERGIPAAMSFSLWSVERSAGDTAAAVVPPTDNAARAWRVGVRLTDLRMAIEARDSVLTRELARELVGLLSDPTQGTATPFFRGIATAPIPLDYGSLTVDVARGEEAIAPPLDPANISLGKWTESARIAAHREDLSFFERREWRETLGILSLPPSPPFPEATTEIARGMSRTLGQLRTTPTPERWNELRDAAERLVRELGR